MANENMASYSYGTVLKLWQVCEIWQVWKYGKWKYGKCGNMVSDLTWHRSQNMASVEMNMANENMASD